MINQENFMNLWRSSLFLLLFLATHLTKESSFDWFKSHSPLFKSQRPDHQEVFDFFLFFPISFLCKEIGAFMSTMWGDIKLTTV